MSSATPNAPVFHPARRLDGVSESATLKLNAKVQAMKAAGLDVINLTAGEPDFNVPDVAKEAVVESLKLNRSRYTPAAGIPELRAAVAEKTNRQQPSLATPWKAADVVITNGGKQALFNSFMAMLDPGDEVLIPSPFWLSYPEMVKLAGGTPRLVHATRAQGFKISPTQLQAAIGAKTKMLVLNSPSNPTGAMYSQAELAALGEVLEQAPHVWIISDEIYDRIILADVPFCSFLAACPDLAGRTITANGMSKSAAMTGWRVGWSVAPAAITQSMITLQGQSTSNVNALAQWASVAALKLPESEFAGQVESYRRRRAMVLDILGKAGKIDVFPAQGAFYAFVGIGNCLRPGEDSFGFCERLLDAAKVAVVPGTPFGEPSSVRLSFALDERSLEEGCRRLAAFVSS